MAELKLEALVPRLEKAVEKLETAGSSVKENGNFVAALVARLEKAVEKLETAGFSVKEEVKITAKPVPTQSAQPTQFKENYDFSAYRAKVDIFSNLGDQLAKNHNNEDYKKLVRYYLYGHDFNFD